MKLSPAMERYVLHWGEMGTRWGVNRSIAQIHALLYISPHPLPADEIVETLGIARSNVSTSLRELQSWGLVGLVHIRGDRRDHFEALKDNWEILTRIVEERKKREIDPTLTMLRAAVMEAREDGETPTYAKEKMEGLLAFMETLSSWYDQVNRLPRTTLIALMKMGGKVANFVKRAP